MIDFRGAYGTHDNAQTLPDADGHRPPQHKRFPLSDSYWPPLVVVLVRLSRPGSV